MSSAPSAITMRTSPTIHTGGVPGRHELDDTQELQWPAICRAIADTGFKGFVAHEFVPVRDPLTSLREAVVLCDV